MMIMVFTMNAFVAAADILGSRILEINERIIARLSLLERAAHIAKDAAPYMHPRLANVKHADRCRRLSQPHSLQLHPLPRISDNGPF